MIPKKQLEKEISKIRDGCNKELGEDYQELICGEDFDNEESESGASFILCENCREKLFKAEATLTQANEIIKLIEECKEYIGTTKEQDKDGASPLISKEELLTKIKGDGE